jgi:hypothetical protein
MPKGRLKVFYNQENKVKEFKQFLTNYLTQVDVADELKLGDILNSTNCYLTFYGTDTNGYAGILDLCTHLTQKLDGKGMSQLIYAMFVDFILCRTMNNKRMYVIKNIYKERPAKWKFIALGKSKQKWKTNKQRENKKEVRK